jgi:hypothetical protein
VLFATDLLKRGMPLRIMKPATAIEIEEPERVRIFGKVK